MGFKLVCNHFCLHMLIHQCEISFVVMHFSFQSSLAEVPFDTTDNALTIFRCSSASQYVGRIISYQQYSIMFTGVLIVLRLVVCVGGVRSGQYVVDYLKTVLMLPILCR